MRITESIVVAARPEEIWAPITDPTAYQSFMAGITRWEIRGEIERGLGARYRMAMQVGSAEVGGTVEIIEEIEHKDLAWTSVLGIDQRGRWRLREVDDRITRVELRFSYGVAGSGLGGWLSERLSAPTVRGHIRESLRRLKALVEGERRASEAAAARDGQPA